MMKNNWKFDITSFQAWKNGSVGFGFGLWRINYGYAIIWSLALGPFTFYVSKRNSDFKLDED